MADKFSNHETYVKRNISSDVATILTSIRTDVIAWSGSVHYQMRQVQDILMTDIPLAPRTVSLYYELTSDKSYTCPHAIHLQEIITSFSY